MKKKNYVKVYIPFFILYTVFLIYNLVRGSQWAYDAFSSILLLAAFYFIGKKLNIKTPSILLFNLALIVHNLGTFGFYEFGLGVIEYDNLSHIIAAFAGGFIITKVISRRLHVKKGLFFKRAIEKHRLLALLFVIAFVVFLGMLVELVEFFSFFYFGTGEGLFFTGPGDYDMTNLAGEYFDVMTDLISNIVGAVLGVLAYYSFRIKR